MPKKRTRKPVRKKESKRAFHKLFVYFLIVIFLLVGLSALVITLQRSVWQAGDRFVVLTQNSDDSATFFIYEPQSASMYKLTIPANTQLESANDLGRWKLGSLWQLYENEELNKGVLVDTFTLSTGLSADAWVGDCGYVVFCKDTNLKFKDKLKLAIFEIKVAKSQVVEIDPLNYGLLHEATFLDGDKGYVVADNLPSSIIRLFASENVLDQRPRISLKNYARSSENVDKISRAVEVLGIKIVSIERDEPQDFNCRVNSRSTENKLTAEKLAHVFGCEAKSLNEGNFDIILEVGEKFWKRF